MASERGEEGFRAWKYAVGLSESFPTLRPLTNGEIIEGRVHTLHLGEEEQWLWVQAGSQSSAIIIPIGQGTTTLTRWAALKLSEKFEYGKIPVVLRVEDVDGEFSVEDIISEVRSQIVEAMVSNRWENIIGRARYANLIGAPSASKEDIAGRRQFLRTIVSQGDIFALTDTPLTQQSLPELMAEISDRIAVPILIDLSSGRPEHKVSRQEGWKTASVQINGDGAFSVDTVPRLRDEHTESYFALIDVVSGVLEDFHGYVHESGIPASRLFVTTFGTQTATQHVRNGVPIDHDNRIEVRRLQTLDLFCILRDAFPRTSHVGNYEDDLAVVLHDTFLAPFNSADVSINTALAQFADWCEATVFDRDSSKWPFQLSESNLSSIGILPAGYRVLGEVGELRKELEAARLQFDTLRAAGGPTE